MFLAAEQKVIGSAILGAVLGVAGSCHPALRFRTHRAAYLAGCISATLLSMIFYARGTSHSRTLNEKHRQNLKGKVAVVTGANVGIGFETALQLAQLGCKVVITCRTEAQTQRAKQEMIERDKKERGTDAIPLDIDDRFSLELSDLESVRRFAENFLETRLPLHLLVNNAGFGSQHLEYGAVHPQFEQHTLVNFLGPFLLTELLVKTLKACNGRVICVASAAHLIFQRMKHLRKLGGPVYHLRALNNREGVMITSPHGFQEWFMRYGLSKLCNVYHAHYLVNVHGVEACSLHPGLVSTHFARTVVPVSVHHSLYYVSLLWFKTPCEGSQTTMYCALAPSDRLKPIEQKKREGGATQWVKRARYFVDCKDASNTWNFAAEGLDMIEAERVADWASDSLKDFLLPRP